MNYNKIENKIEQMLKDRIKQLNLVKTGKLLNSISVKSDGKGGFDVTAEDYFTVLDEKNNISNYVFESAELTSFITKEVTKQIEEELKK